MMLSDDERIQLRACSAIITRNRRELEWAITNPIEVLGQDISAEAHHVCGEAPIPGQHVLLRIVNYLPVSVQFVGQRAVLLFPSLSRRLLRSSGIHHQMF